MITNDTVSKSMGYLDLVSKKRNTHILLGLIIGFIVCSASANAIYGGKPVEMGDLDAIGKVTSKECSGYYCTGTLIQGNVVLTVAHLFDGICAGPKGKATKAIFTVNGRPFRGTVKRYKNYVRGSGDPNNDIALIILNQNVSKELGIKPIPIANNDESKDNGKSKNLTIVGIGPISQDCKKSSFGNKYKCTLCTTDGIETTALKPCNKEKIAGTCDGDSGGPALDMNNQIVAIASEDKRDYYREILEKSAGNVFTEINKDNTKNKDKYNWIRCEMENAREKRGIEC